MQGGWVRETAQASGMAWISSIEPRMEHDAVHIPGCETVTRDTREETATLRRLIEFERARKAPPAVGVIIELNAREH